MAAGVYNLVIDQGSDFGIRVTVTQNSTPVNLTGYSARAQLRKTKLASGAPSASFVCTVPAPQANGVVTMNMSNSVSSSLEAGQYFYDLEIFTVGDAQATRILQGEVKITAEVTR
jgi:hypothetical protein